MDVSFISFSVRESHYPPPDRPEVAFAGRSNVGKSSLINVLLNRKKMARTSSTPGRTQAIHFYSVGRGLYFVDLPGYGFARVPLEVKASWKGMVDTYLRKRPNLKAVVVILDIRREPTRGDMDLLNWLRAYGREAIPVLTKTDKLSRSQVRLRAAEIARRVEPICSAGPVVFSAKTREGREEIWERIRRATGIEMCPGRKP
ncbi:MAG: YihA family ribosome biogenesis GTP-binding protein [Deltaproteobacteria bacterium]|nr:YihA family ribosome biogenesis GTP-binding protein [Deltaproteobacteria bacterium]